MRFGGIGRKGRIGSIGGWGRIRDFGRIVEKLLVLRELVALGDWEIDKFGGNGNSSYLSQRIGRIDRFGGIGSIGIELVNW